MGGEQENAFTPTREGCGAPRSGDHPPRWGGITPQVGGYDEKWADFCAKKIPIYGCVKTSPELFRRDLKLVWRVSKLVRNFFGTRPPRCMKMPKLVRNCLCFPQKKHFILDRFSFRESCRLSSRFRNSTRECQQLPPVIRTAFPNNHLSVHLVLENCGNKRRPFSAVLPLFCSAESFSPEFIQQMLSIPG
mgnify:CR=1 FL=1